MKKILRSRWLRYFLVGPILLLSVALADDEAICNKARKDARKGTQRPLTDIVKTGGSISDIITYYDCYYDELRQQPDKRAGAYCHPECVGALLVFILVIALLDQYDFDNDEWSW